MRFGNEAYQDGVKYCSKCEIFMLNEKIYVLAVTGD
jgi:hypothetical protein